MYSSHRRAVGVLPRHPALLLFGGDGSSKKKRKKRMLRSSVNASADPQKKKRTQNMAEIPNLVLERILCHAIGTTGVAIADPIPTFWLSCVLVASPFAVPRLTRMVLTQARALDIATAFDTALLDAWWTHVSPTSCVTRLNRAIRRRTPDVPWTVAALQWWFDHNVYIGNDDRGLVLAEAASRSGRLTVLDWVCDHYGGASPSLDHYTSAIDAAQSVAVLDWWWAKRGDGSVFPYTTAVLGAVLGGRADVLAWWEARATVDGITLRCQKIASRRMPSDAPGRLRGISVRDLATTIVTHGTAPVLWWKRMVNSPIEPDMTAIELATLFVKKQLSIEGLKVWDGIPELLKPEIDTLLVDWSREGHLEHLEWHFKSLAEKEDDDEDDDEGDDSDHEIEVPSSIQLKVDKVRVMAFWRSVANNHGLDLPEITLIPTADDTVEELQEWWDLCENEFGVDQELDEPISAGTLPVLQWWAQRKMQPDEEPPGFYINDIFKQAWIACDLAVLNWCMIPDRFAEMDLLHFNGSDLLKLAFSSPTDVTTDDDELDDNDRRLVWWSGQEQLWKLRDLHPEAAAVHGILRSRRAIVEGWLAAGLLNPTSLFTCVYLYGAATPDQIVDALSWLATAAATYQLPWSVESACVDRMLARRSLVDGRVLDWCVDKRDGLDFQYNDGDARKAMAHEMCAASLQPLSK
ncbi:hypothetical protein BC828DRAFT_87115 [Blastocladiella britannica]|nr:hypothetical protein BC828DRAFT_87115 [Blastocladiella britannica]